MSRFFGPINQGAYVVEDWESAARRWIDKLDVRPFFLLRHLEFSRCFYRGGPTDTNVTMALAFSAEHLSELV